MDNDDTFSHKESAQEFFARIHKVKEIRERDTLSNYSILFPSKSLFDIFEKDKWYKDRIYTDIDRFNIASKYSYYKKDRGFYTVEDLLNLISKNGSIIHLSEDLPLSLIPYGRDGTNIDKDYEFYQHTKQCDVSSYKNTLFINYTGHCGPVGAVLAENGVPLTWNLSLKDASFTEARIINQIQDYSKSLSIPQRKESTNYGLMLEPPHSLIETINFDELPSPFHYKKMGINNVVVFIEMPFCKDTKSKLSLETTYNQEFLDYVMGFSYHQMPIRAIGISKNDQLKEEPPEKELLSLKSEMYQSNFTLQSQILR